MGSPNPSSFEEPIGASGQEAKRLEVDGSSLERPDPKQTGRSGEAPQASVNESLAPGKKHWPKTRLRKWNPRSRNQNMCFFLFSSFAG